jgi:hypothetical protein
VCDAVVVNEREQGRVIHVMTCLVYGTTEPVGAARQASPVRRVITTDGVERHHLPMRPHARRMGRQVQACSSAPDDLEPQRTLACADDHVVVPHRGLRDACPDACPPKAATARAGFAQIFKIEYKIDGFILLKIDKMSPKRTFWAKPLAPVVAAGHPGHGSQTDRSCLDDGRVVERSHATETPVVITPKALVPVIGTLPINVGPDSCERVSSSPCHPTLSRSVRPV